ncbi:MAG: DUF1566 domain-containing protein [Nitrospinae bacterium]|nr:DUF1566 domain-containing protein [Nitrospinota bacterium]
MKKIAAFCLLFIFFSSPFLFAEEAGRFVDNGDGTVTDSQSGLMWIKDPDFFGNRCKENRKDFFCELLISKELAFLPWKKADLAVRMISLAGHKDWRLPEKEEIEILNKIHKGELKNPFGGILEMYWTSSPGGKSNTSWMIFPQQGIFAAINHESLGFVWPVRNAGK